ncbi:MAG: FtsW/RodA/SpoVE family cell cycle protein [Planctomycetes bacterium]|nr:FtsW/RodA/SpoVE family cell cycle protein [Planctomycetota bacterium]
MSAAASMTSPPLGYTGGRALGRGGFSWLNSGWIVVAAAAMLTLLGCAAIATTEPSLAKRQLVLAVFGMVVAVAACLPSHKLLSKSAWPMYFISLFLLLLVLVPGTPEWIVRPKNGARRWISVGLFEFQPSEIAKLALVLVLAKWLRRPPALFKWRGFFAPFVIAMPLCLLTLIEPDLGSAMLFIPPVLAMLLVAGARKKHIATLIIGVLVMAPISYPFLWPHQRERVDALLAQFRGDDRYARDIGFQADRAMTLVGSGGFAGNGRDHAEALVRNNHLPEEHNDMIFAVICCRWGFLGGLFTWGLGLLYAGGAAICALSTRDSFSRLIATGVAAIVFTQISINTGMALGVLPVTGITLPFVSYGGSSMVSGWFATGIIFGLGLRKPRTLESLGGVR